MSITPMISLRGVWFSYNGASHAVLRDLSLTIPAASVTTILGPNGSGKSTLLLILLGLLVPQQGEVFIAGRRRDDYPQPAMGRLIGLVPQEEQFPIGLSALEYVLLGRAPHLGILDRPGETDYQIALEALDLAGLIALKDRPVALMSGGERQLVTIARALAQRPRILLLDEPTSHLDLANTRRILRLLRELTQGGVTVVFTTHDPNAAATAADYAVLIKGGQIPAVGRVEEVFTVENLSQTYGVPVEITQINERPFVLAL
jgi:iron complex transport system ATP-binding protein